MKSKSKPEVYGSLKAGEIFRTGTVAIVGRPNVGKSTLLNALIGQKISITSRKPQTTRHRILGIFTSSDTQYLFVDTPGFQTRHGGSLNQTLNRTVTQTLTGVDATLFVVEALRFGPEDKAILDLLPIGIPTVLAINKADHVKNRDELLPFLQEMATRFQFVAAVPVSAAKGWQITDLLAAIRVHLPEGLPIYGADDITDRSERFLAAELIREKAFRLLGEELPYSLSVVIDKFEEEGNLRRIAATLIVDRPTHRVIIIGKKGEKLKEIATAARIDMEKLFGAKVFLETWVKVKNGWADNEKLLRELGYE